MRTHEVELPAGLVVKMRSFQVQDENLLANPKSIRKGLATTDLLKAVTVELLDPGLYTFQDRVDWNVVLQGERHDALRQNRIFTRPGEPFTFRQKCPRCDTPMETDVDLSCWDPDEAEEGEEKPETSFEIKKLPEGSRGHVQQGTPLQCALPMCGVAVEFRLLRGSDEKMLQKLGKQKKDALSSAYLRYRTTKVDGVKGGDLEEFFRYMEGADAAFLRSAFDEADCGVEQEIVFECGTCDHFWHEDVRFDKDFLFPRYRAKTTRAGS